MNKNELDEAETDDCIYPTYNYLAKLYLLESLPFDERLSIELNEELGLIPYDELNAKLGVPY